MKGEEIVSVPGETMPSRTKRRMGEQKIELPLNLMSLFCGYGASKIFEERWL